MQDADDLVYLKARHYNPVLGRFYQPDPVTFIMKGHGQTNRYQYGWNDSYSFSDPEGLYPWDSGYKNEIGQRIYNGFVTGNFWTDDQINNWGLGLIGAKYAGIADDYIRENPIGGFTKFVATMGSPSAGVKLGVESGANSAMRQLDNFGGHIVERHIGKSISDLNIRLSSSRISAATSFNDARTAGRVVGDSLINNQLRINSWLSTSPTKI